MNRGTLSRPCVLTCWQPARRRLSPRRLLFAQGRQQRLGQRRCVAEREARQPAAGLRAVFLRWRQECAGLLPDAAGVIRNPPPSTSWSASYSMRVCAVRMARLHSCNSSLAPSTDKTQYADMLTNTCNAAVRGMHKTPRGQDRVHSLAVFCCVAALIPQPKLPALSWYSQCGHCALRTSTGRLSRYSIRRSSCPSVAHVAVSPSRPLSVTAAAEGATTCASVSAPAAAQALISTRASGGASDGTPGAAVSAIAAELAAAAPSTVAGAGGSIGPPAIVAAKATRPGADGPELGSGRCTAGFGCIVSAYIVVVRPNVDSWSKPLMQFTISILRCIAVGR